MWETIFQYGGTALSAFGSWYAGKASEDYYDQQAANTEAAAAVNAEISLYDAAVAENEAFAAELSAGVELRNHQRTVDRLLGSTQAKLAKQGAVVGTGSSLDIMVDVAKEGSRDADIIRYNGETKAQRYRSMATRYRKLAASGLRDAALTANLLEDAGSASRIYYGISGATDVLKSLSKMWSE